MEAFVEGLGLILYAVMDFYYLSKTYCLISKGVSNLYCISETYLTNELEAEYQKKDSL